MPDFLPRPDLELRNWTKRFAEQLLGDPSLFHVSVEQAEAYAVVQSAFAEAWQQTSDNSTRTPVAIIRKDEQRVELVTQTRRLAAWIRVQLRDRSDLLVRLGLHIGPGQSGRRTRQPVPTARVALSVMRVDGSTLTLRVCEDGPSSRRRKPEGTVSVAIYYFVGENYPADDREWRHFRNTGQNITTVDFGASYAPGTRVWLVARWANRRGELGPMGHPIFEYLARPSIKFAVAA